MTRTRDIRRYLKQALSAHRYRHTMGVRKAARALARRHICFGSEKAEKEFLEMVGLAALLHDADKGREVQSLAERLSTQDPARWPALKEYPDIWHAFSAALTARELFGVTDEALLDALRYHTTGRAGMGPLEKIIYLADYIEPGRDFPGLDAIRRAAAKSLDAGCLAAMSHSITYLTGNGCKVSPLTLEARKDLLRHGIF